MENAPELFDKKVKKGRMSRPKYLSLYGPPEILNTDQGKAGFTSVLKAHGVKISMDGRGRFRDNYNTRRPHQALWYRRPEGVYLEGARDVA